MRIAIVSDIRELSTPNDGWFPFDTSIGHTCLLVLFALATVRAQDSSPAVPAGVDYGLKSQCIRTTTPGAVNFFYDNVDCPGPSYPTSKYWTTAVETESSLGVACVGVTNQSFLINGPASPVTEKWTGNSSTGYSVELRTDFSKIANPCGPTSWTWVPLMDNWVGGGPLPPPNSVQSQFNTTFTRNLPPNSGATRAIAGLNAQWNVAGANGAATLNQFLVELNLFTDEPQWGRKPGLPADVINATHAALPFQYDYVNLDGSRLVPPLSVSPSESRLITVNWGAIIQHILDEGLFQPPMNGWSNSAAATSSTFAGTEIANTATGPGGPVADLIVSKYEESSVAITVARAPVLKALAPTSAPAGSTTLSLTITGSGFVDGATAYWSQNGQTTSLPSQFVSATSIIASVPASLLASAGAAQINVANPNGYANLSTTLNFTIGPPDPNRPVIFARGVVPLNGSSDTIQPGSWVSIYGTNLAGQTTIWDGTFPTSLGGTRVTMNGRGAYLSYVSPGQINVQAPDDATIGAVPVVVTTAHGSASTTVNLGHFAPSFALLDNRHVAGIILRADGSGAYGNGTYDIIGPTGTALGYPTVAAKAGDCVELFAVGLGPTNPSVPAGEAFTGEAPTINPVTLLINSVNVAPAFVGLSSAGLYQVNLTIPPGLGTGDVPLAAIAGGIQTSRGVVVSLQ